MGGFLNLLPSILNQGLIWGIMAIGVFITFRILDFADLTVDGSITTGACVFAVLVGAHVPVAIAFIISFFAGTIAGLITAAFHCYLGIPGILSGILTQLILWSINYLILGGSMMTVNNRDSVISSNARLGLYTAIPIITGIVALIIIVLYWFFGTKFGSSIRATGSNENMAKSNGINIRLRKIVALMISNGLVALAGAILTQYKSTATIDMGVGAIVIGLAAIVIGSTIFGKISKNFALQLVFTVLGAIIYFFVFQLIVFYTNKPILLQMLSAIVVAIFLAIPYIKDVYIKNIKAKRQRAKEAK